MWFQLLGWISPGGWEPASDAVEVLCRAASFQTIFLCRPPDARYGVMQPVTQTTMLQPSGQLCFTLAPEFWVVDFFACTVTFTEASIGEHKIYSDLDSAIMATVSTY